MERISVPVIVTVALSLAACATFETPQVMPQGHWETGLGVTLGMTASRDFPARVAGLPSLNLYARAGLGEGWEVYGSLSPALPPLVLVEARCHVRSEPDIVVGAGAVIDVVSWPGAYLSVVAGGRDVWGQARAAVFPSENWLFVAVGAGGRAADITGEGRYGYWTAEVQYLGPPVTLDNEYPSIHPWAVVGGYTTAWLYDW